MYRLSFASPPIGRRHLPVEQRTNHRPSHSHRISPNHLHCNSALAKRPSYRPTSYPEEPQHDRRPFIHVLSRHFAVRYDLLRAYIVSSCQRCLSSRVRYQSHPNDAAARPRYCCWRYSGPKDWILYPVDVLVRCSLTHRCRIDQHFHHHDRS